MIDIMEHLQQYAPVVSEVGKVSIPGVGEKEVHADNFHNLIFGGDQLTAKCARGSQHVRSNSLRGKDRLEGLKLVVEDWHSKVCLLGVSCTNSYYCGKCTCTCKYCITKLVNTVIYICLKVLWYTCIQMTHTFSHLTLL